MTLNWGKAVGAGIAGTVVMTVVGLYVAPIMGIPKMNPADMLAGQVGGNMMLGWAGHFMIGAVLATIYAMVASKLPGPFAIRGAVFGIAPWLMAMVVMMPIMGMPMFGGAATAAMGSLIGHLVYGAVVGVVYGDPVRR